MSKPWSDTTKRWVATGLVLAGLAVLYRMRALLPPVILACLLAYLLSPVVDRLSHTRLSRNVATAIAYVLLLLGLVLAVYMLVPMTVQQISSINVDLQQINEGVLLILSRYQTITILDYTIELSDVYAALEDSLIQLITSYASRSAEEMLVLAFGIASGFASTLIWLIFILVVSFWLVKDADEITASVRRLVPEGYGEEAEKLWHEVSAVWDSFFRGLLLLALTVGVVTGASIWVVGVKNALLLGMLAAVLEVVPSFGPIIACIPAVAVAYFQGSTHLPIANGWFALLVLALYAVIQQVENNILAPRILGDSVKLHPTVVMFGAIGGYAVGGIVGAFLAAPVIGTFKILGDFVFWKLMEVEAEPEPAEQVSEAAELAQEEQEDAQP